MYGAQQVFETIDSETKSGYNSFGGKSLFDNENSLRSRTRFVQGILDRLAAGKNWNGFSASDIFGTKVEPALFENKPYQPIDYGEVQGKTIDDNLENLDRANELTSGLNASLRDDSANRIDRFAPGFLGNLKTMTDWAKALVGGRLPYSDVMDIVSDRNQSGNLVGTAGTFGAATLKDLGIKRLEAAQAGSDMMSRIGNLVEAIDPIAQRSRASDWMLAPSQTVPLKQADTQFGANYDQMERILKQTSEQNANVLNAAPDPAGRGLFGAEFALKTGGAPGGLGTTGVSGVDWGSLVSSLWGGYKQMQGNGYGSGQPAAVNYQRFNPDSGNLYAGTSSQPSAANNWGYDPGNWEGTMP